MEADETLDVTEDSLESPFEDEQEHSINRRSLSLVSISVFFSSLSIQWKMDREPYTKLRVREWGVLELVVV